MPSMVLAFDLAMLLIQITLRLLIGLRLFRKRCPALLIAGFSLLLLSIHVLFDSYAWPQLIGAYAISFLVYRFAGGMPLRVGLFAAAGQCFASLTMDSLLGTLYLIAVPAPTPSGNMFFRALATVLWLALLIVACRAGALRFDLLFTQRVSPVMKLLTFDALFIGLFFCLNQNLIQKGGYLPASVGVVNSLMLLAMQLFGVYHIIKISKYAAAVEKLGLQQLYMDTLKFSLEKLRSFQHDFHNILNTLGGFVTLERYDLLAEYMEKLMQEMVPLQSLEIANAALREAPLIYGVVVSKLAIAELNSIHMPMTITANDLDLKTMNQVEFSRVLGNLLDNALEAAQESGEKIVDLAIHNQLDKLHIVIRNTFSNAKEIDLNEIFEPGYSTKKDHVGIGLNETMKIVNKHRDKGLYVSLYAHMDDKYFTVELLA